MTDGKLAYHCSKLRTILKRITATIRFHIQCLLRSIFCMSLVLIAFHNARLSFFKGDKCFDKK